MKKQLFIITVLLLSLLLHTTTGEAAPSYNPFTDLPTSNPYFKDIISLYKKGLLEGYEDKSFRPGQLITRAEFVKMVLGIGQCIDCRYAPQDIKQQYIQQPFIDIFTDAWYFYCIAHAKKLGIITGYLGEEKQGLFAPEDPISRAESVAILLRAIGTQPDINTPLLLQDVNPNAWYYNYIKTAINKGLIPYHNGFIAPEEKISRDEFAHLIAMEWQEKACTEIRKDTSDTDKDGIPNPSDMCPTIPGQEQYKGCPSSTDIDKDGDSVPDTEDLCPTIPGNLKNATNIQGCPSIGEKLQASIPGILIKKPICNTCPCPTLEYKADIRPGDILFTTIADPTRATIYTKSNPYYIAE